MWRIIPFAVMQSLLLCSGQVFLKFALAKMPPFAWSKDFFAALALNWQLAACGLLFGSASLVWMYILRHFPFRRPYCFFTKKCPCRNGAAWPASSWDAP